MDYQVSHVEQWTRRPEIPSNIWATVSLRKIDNFIHRIHFSSHQFSHLIRHETFIFTIHVFLFYLSAQKVFSWVEVGDVLVDTITADLDPSRTINEFWASIPAKLFLLLITRALLFPFVNDVWQLCWFVWEWFEWETQWLWVEGFIWNFYQKRFSSSACPPFLSLYAIHVLTTEHPILRFKLGVMCIMCVVDWMNECSWSSLLKYLERPYCECHFWFRCWLLCVRQWPRSRTFLNSRRNFPVWNRDFQWKCISNAIIVLITHLTWNCKSMDWLHYLHSIANGTKATESLVNRFDYSHMNTDRCWVHARESSRLQTLRLQLPAFLRLFSSLSVEQRLWNWTRHDWIVEFCLRNCGIIEKVKFNGKLYRVSYFSCNKLFSSHVQESCWSARGLLRFECTRSTSKAEAGWNENWSFCIHQQKSMSKQKHVEIFLWNTHV